MNTQRINELFESDLSVVNMGLDGFGDDLEREGVNVARIDWRPPARGNEQVAQLLTKLDAGLTTDVEAANREAVSRILKGKPTLVGIGSAGEDVPGMRKDLILHAGPPVEWERMCGPLRGAIMGGLIYEGLAKDAAEAGKIARSGDVEFSPCHHHSMVGPMAGVVTASMPVWILENKTFGNRAYATLNEGLGKVLRYGAFGPDVIEKLRWIQDELAPILRKALALHGEFDMKSMISQALQMGDEGHNRNRAATSLFIRELASHLVMIDEDSRKISNVLRFLNSNDHFFLNLSMPSCKCTVDAAAEIRGSSVIVAMARNGTDFGIRVSGLGNRWFTGPASMVDGLYLPGFSAQDAAPDIGDSVIAETCGIGGFAMAAAPAIVKFVGGNPEDALSFTRQMYEITLAENDAYQIPALDFRGTPTGIDLIKVEETGILPAINTGIAHKEPGVGMVGAGLAKPPEKCFDDALEAFVEQYAL